MATSGTVCETTVTLDYIYEAAARRCGVTPDKLSPESLDILKKTLFMLLSDWGSRGIKLWRIQRPLVGLQVGQSDYDLAAGTIDVLNANFRTPQRLEAETLTSSNGGTTANAVDGDVGTLFTMSGTGNLKFDFGSGADDTQVFLVGLLPGATGALTLIFEYSTDGVTWSTAYSPGAATYTDSIWTWYAIEPAHAAQYFRVRSSLGTISMREIFLAQNWTDVTLARMNKDDYMALPNKTFASRQVYQYWLDRQREQPVMVFWPLPANTFTLISLLTHKYIEDPGAMTNEPDVPQRWLEPVVSSLALRVLMELPFADLARYPTLKEQAVEPKADAEGEEVDRSPIRLTPRISGYTR